MLVPVEPAVPALRQLARRARARRRDHEPAEAVLVAAPRDLLRRPATTRTTVARTPTPVRRVRGARAAPAARCRRRDRRSTRPAIPPRRSRTRGDRRSARTAAGRHRPRRHPRRPSPRRCRRAPRCATRPTACRADPTRATRAAIRRVTTPDPTHSRPSIGAAATRSPSRGTTAMSHASSRSIDERDLAPGRDRRARSARPSRVSARTTRPSRRRRRRRPSAAGDHELVVGPPRRSRRRRRCRAVTITGGAVASAGRRRGRPGRRGPRSRPGGRRSGDQRGSATEPERATIAGVITERTLPNARRNARSRAQRARPATRLASRRRSSILGTSCLRPPAVLPRPPLPAPGDPLRIAFLIYRGNPHCGGQGVYSRHLTRELDRTRARGHDARRPAVAGRRPARHARAGARPRPLPARQPVPCALAVRVPHGDRRAGVRDHVLGGLSRAVRVQPPRLPAPPRPPLRVRPRPRQPVPRLRVARLPARRVAVREHVAPPDHRRPRPRARPRHVARAQARRCAAGTASSACR